MNKSTEPAWRPKRGERVLAILPDGHEIEGVYRLGMAHHYVMLADDGQYVRVATVKPLPVTEPTAQLARAIDGKGVRRYLSGGRWYPVGAVGQLPLFWDEVPQPVTIIDADPDWTVR